MNCAELRPDRLTRRWRQLRRSSALRLLAAQALLGSLAASPAIQPRHPAKDTCPCIASPLSPDPSLLDLKASRQAISAAGNLWKFHPGSDCNGAGPASTNHDWKLLDRAKTGTPRAITKGSSKPGFALPC